MLNDAVATIDRLPARFGTSDRALATVTFHNFDHTSLLAITMKREHDGWKVDDIASMGSDQNWLLSWLLQYDPFGVN